jgi:hypothetical protein
MGLRALGWKAPPARYWHFISQLNSYSSSNEGVETRALIRLGMMACFLVKADQDGMGFWAPSLFGEASTGLRAWEGGAKHWR